MTAPDLLTTSPETDSLAPGAAAVETHELVRMFGAQRAVDGLTFEVRKGESVGLLGPNGAGKTTTIRILSTLTAPTSGRVRILGLDPAREALSIRRRIGVVPQDLAVYDELSARENVEFFGRLYGIEGARLRDRVAWALDQSGLSERAGDRVKTFSGGMKRRLNIVVALLHEPELLFLDEPTVGLDPQSRNHILEMVERLIADGMTLIYTTHQLGEVERLCQRILILDHGRLLAQGSMADLARHARDAGPASFRIDAGARGEELAALLRERGIAFRHETKTPTLEEIFLALTGRALRDEERA